MTRREWRAAIASLDAVSGPAAERAGLGAIVPWARYYLGWAAVRAGSLDQAAAALDALVAAGRRTRSRSAALFLAGWARFGLKAWDAAADRFARAAAGKDRDLAARSRYLRAKSLQNAGRLAEASTAFRAMADAAPRTDLSDDALYEYASIADSLGSTAAAADAFARLARDFPDSPFAETALFARAESLRKGGEERGCAGRLRGRTAARTRRASLVDASLYWGGVAAAGRRRAVRGRARVGAARRGAPRQPLPGPRAAEDRGGLRRGAPARARRSRSTTGWWPSTPRRRWRPAPASAPRSCATSSPGVGDREAELLARIRAVDGHRPPRRPGRARPLYVLSGEKKVEDGYKLALQVAAEKDPLPASRALAVAAEYWYRKGRFPARPPGSSSTPRPPGLATPRSPPRRSTGPRR